MQIIKLKKNRIKLIAEEGQIIRSKSTYTEEGKTIFDVEGKTIYLGKNDKVENYEEVEESVENVDNTEETSESVVE